MKTKLIVLAAVMLLFSTAYGLAQDQSGSIWGIVRSTDGGVITGAKIVAASPALIRAREAFTNERGYYVFPALPVGTYSLTFSAENYRTYEQKDTRPWKSVSWASS